MMDLPDIKLTYFDTRGRGQFIRNFLHYREVPFEDNRVALSADFREWLTIKTESEITGPFHKLPVLTWGDNMVTETMVIHAFLHNQLGDASTLSAEEKYQQSMLASSLYVDLMMPVGTLIWSDILFEGLDLGLMVNKSQNRIRDHLKLLDEVLAEWKWLDKLYDRPLTITDSLLWEELDVIKYVFRDHIPFDGMKSLDKFYNDCPGLKVFKKVIQQHPIRITGRPAEPEAIIRIQSILDGQV